MFVQVKAGVRYWEDGKINGVTDTEGKIPFREGDCWCPTIDLPTGEIIGWPEGMDADIHYKVCDAGEYWILDNHLRPIKKWQGSYVPRLLCPMENGYGDYVILTIRGGMIQGWVGDISKGWA